jgi:hypothetical protein
MLSRFIGLSFRGSLSSGDLATAAQPAPARESGEFLIPKPAGVDILSLVLAPLTVVGIGLLPQYHSCRGYHREAVRGLPVIGHGQTLQ